MKLADQKLPWTPEISRCGIGLAVLLETYVARHDAAEFTRTHVLHLPYSTGVSDALTPFASLVMPACAVAAVLFIVGVVPRVAAAVTVVTLGSFLLADQQNYTNHVVFFSCLLLICAVCGGLTARRPQDEKALLTVALAVQMTLIYGFAALNKITPGYLSGDEIAGVMRGPVYLHFLRDRAGLDAVLAIAAVMTEASLAVAPWVRRIPRVVPLVLCGVFHLSILALVSRGTALIAFGGASFAAYWGALAWRDNRVPSERVRTAQ